MSQSCPHCKEWLPTVTGTTCPRCRLDLSAPPAKFTEVPDQATVVGNSAQHVGAVLVLLLVMGWAGHNLFRYNWQWFASFSAIAVHCLRARVAAREGAWESAPYGQFAWQT